MNYSENLDQNVDQLQFDGNIICSKRVNSVGKIAGTNSTTSVTV